MNEFKGIFKDELKSFIKYKKFKNKLVDLKNINNYFFMYVQMKIV